MNDKYYTPSIEEFHVGFEYELKDEYISESQRLIDWYSQIVNSVQELESVEFEMQRNYVRVKYLDSEDIESLGFKADYSGERYYELGDFQMYLNIHPIHNVTIYNVDSEIVFQGTVKNKSELVRLLKQLDIID